MLGDWRLKAVYILSAIGAVVTFGMLLCGGGFKSFLSGFSLWVLLPYVLFAVLARLSKSKLFRIILVGAALISVVVGIFFYIDAYFIHPDAQGALVFVVVPLYQVLAALGVLIVWGIVILTQRLLYKTSST